MARKKDPNSVRQQALKLLDTMTNIKREDVLDDLKSRYGIGDSYAQTLYAAHRTISKKNGVMTKVYIIRDMKNGKPVTPYLKIENTFNPAPDACLTAELAIAQYVLRLKNKIAKVQQL